MTKKVNIYPTRPIITVNPPIRSAVKNVTKPVEDIRACIMARAIVEEICLDGSTVRLDLNNYNKVIVTAPVEVVFSTTQAINDFAIEKKAEEMMAKITQAELEDTEEEVVASVEDAVGSTSSATPVINISVTEEEVKDMMSVSTDMKEILPKTYQILKEADVPNVSDSVVVEDAVETHEETEEKPVNHQQRPQQYQKNNNKKNRK